jgi:hypothetical protein
VKETFEREVKLQGDAVGELVRLLPAGTRRAGLVPVARLRTRRVGVKA